MQNKALLCGFFIGVLTGCFFGWQLQKSDTTVIEKHSVDTIIVNHIDTIRQVHPIYITERVVDTCFIEKPVQSIPIVQRHYADNDLYDLWISGFQPNLDSIRVYNKIEYRDVYHEIERQTYVKRNELFIGAGFKAIQGTLMPNATISLKTKKDWLIQAEIGLYEQELTYGFTVSKKITR